MLALVHVLELLAISYGFAFLAWPAMRWAASPVIGDGLMILAVLITGILAHDLSAPIRALVVISGLILLLRVHSYGCGPCEGGFGDYLHFLSAGLVSPHLLYSSEREPLVSEIPLRRQFLRLGMAVLAILVTWKVAALLIGTPWSVHSWVVNHLILAGGFIVVMTAFGQCATVIWQVQGSAAKPLVDHIFLARTPAEFWRRWSWPMHQWLYRHVYIPAGGRIHHIRATLLVFLVSGLLHEFIAALVIGRVTGHQTIFFMLSSFGVLLSPTLEKLEQRGVFAQSLGRVFTLSFLIATSSFMFATVHYVYPIYYKHTWLLW